MARPRTTLPRLEPGDRLNVPKLLAGDVAGVLDELSSPAAG